VTKIVTEYLPISQAEPKDLVNFINLFKLDHSPLSFATLAYPSESKTSYTHLKTQHLKIKDISLAYILQYVS